MLWCEVMIEPEELAWALKDIWTVNFIIYASSVWSGHHTHYCIWLVRTIRAIAIHAFILRREIILEMEAIAVFTLPKVYSGLHFLWSCNIVCLLIVIYIRVLHFKFVFCSRLIYDVMRPAKIVDFRLLCGKYSPFLSSDFLSLLTFFCLSKILSLGRRLFLSAFYPALVKLKRSLCGYYPLLAISGRILL